MKAIPLPFLAALLFISLPPAFGQGGGRGVTGGIHRTLSALEAELLALVDRRERLVLQIEARKNEINQLSLQRIKVHGVERDQLSGRIEQLNSANRVAGVEINRQRFTGERIRTETDRIMRFDSRMQGGGKGGGRAQQVRDVNVVRHDRKGSMEVPGQGCGFQETTVYEIVFSVGSSQRVESISFAPQR